MKNTKLAQSLFNTTVVLFGIAGLGNLAISQIHISTITKVFAPEIGFYFFLFIIFGLVSFMNSLNLRKASSNSGNAILTGIFGVLASGMGLVYIKILLDDIAKENLLTMSDIRPTLYIVGASAVIYGIGCLVSVITYQAAKKEV